MSERKNESPGALAGATGALSRAERLGKWCRWPRKARRICDGKSPQQRWRERNPLADWSHSATRSAIRRGLITRQPCAVCGARETDAHHPNYLHPLEVRWLCRVHHKRLHVGAGQ